MQHTANPSGNHKEFGRGERTSRPQHRQHQPEKILLAFAEQGEVGRRQGHRQGTEAQQVHDALSGVGISHQVVVAALRPTASEKFIASWDELVRP
jgi:hypothetical protein